MPPGFATHLVIARTHPRPDSRVAPVPPWLLDFSSPRSVAVGSAPANLRPQFPLFKSCVVLKKVVSVRFPHGIVAQSSFSRLTLSVKLQLDFCRVKIGQTKFWPASSPLRMRSKYLLVSFQIHLRVAIVNWLVTLHLWAGCHGLNWGWLFGFGTVGGCATLVFAIQQYTERLNCWTWIIVYRFYSLSLLIALHGPSKCLRFIDQVFFHILLKFNSSPDQIDFALITFAFRTNCATSPCHFEVTASHSTWQWDCLPSL